MSSIAPIPSPLSGAIPASTRSAEAFQRPSSSAPSSSAAHPVVASLNGGAQAASQANRLTESAAFPQEQVPNKNELQKQIDQVLANANVQTALQFRVDEDAKRVVVSVVDSNSGETILQIPSEAALAVAKRLAEFGSGLLSQEV